MRYNGGGINRPEGSTGNETWDRRELRDNELLWQPTCLLVVRKRPAPRAGGVRKLPSQLKSLHGNNLAAESVKAQTLDVDTGDATEIRQPWTKGDFER